MHSLPHVSSPGTLSRCIHVLSRYMSVDLSVLEGTCMFAAFTQGDYFC